MIKFGSQPFQESIDLFRKKLNLPTNGWRDIQKNSHDVAFVIAGAKKSALIADFRSSIEQMLTDGKTLSKFRKDFDAIVKKHGWSYNGGRNWRSGVIYQTNLNTAYAAGREAQFADADFQKAVPYLQYHHSGAEHYRPEHKSWHNLILPIDDPWWATHSPPNGWSCGCTKGGITQEEMDTEGLKVGDTPNNGTVTHTDKKTGKTTTVPKGIDPGWDYRPGDAWLHSQTAQFNPDGFGGRIPNTTALDYLTNARKLPRSILINKSVSNKQAVDLFMKTLGGAGAFKDKIGEAVVINKGMFYNQKGESKFLKAPSRKQALTVIAHTIKRPDEIWVSVEKTRDTTQKNPYRVVRHYVAKYKIAGDDRDFFAVFETDGGQWSVKSGYELTTKLLNDVRVGIRLYKRGGGN